jgi:hypothetical protein
VPQQGGNYKVEVTDGSNCLVMSDPSITTSTDNISFSPVLKITPNSTQESIDIAFSLAQTGYVALSLYDVQGKILKVVLIPQQLDSGEHRYSVDISLFEPGAYICKLNVNGVVISKVIVKE